MVGATFKTNSEIFTSAWFWPKNPVFDGYENAFKNYGGKINLILSMLNTYKIVIPKVVFTIVSATITAYGFARFNFKGKGFMFSMMKVCASHRGGSMYPMVQSCNHLMASSSIFHHVNHLIAIRYMKFYLGDSVLICSGYLFRIHADPVPERRSEGAGRGSQDRWM